MAPAKTLMIQGTASSVGKSILVTALCRIFKQDGFRVTPFKAQNMALNSFATLDGREIGRAQAVQAEAAGIEPSADMNPVLLKPEADSRSQVIVMGKVAKTITASDYYRYTPHLLEIVKGALERLITTYDMVVIEGAGSPAEINLKDREIVNMRVAKMAQAPVILVGDIDRGGVFASLVGTLELLEKDEQDYIRGFIINKFRGDPKLLESGLRLLEQRTSKPVLGVIPYFHDIRIAQEDSVYLDERQNNEPADDLDIAVIRLPHISNYDDFDPLDADGCRVRYVTDFTKFGRPHLIILPGSKSTISDLQYLWQSGMATEILRQSKEGTPVIGICGGYQMLGNSIHDPQGIESTQGDVLGLGLLDVLTTFASEKSVRQVRAQVLGNRGLLEAMRGQEILGYEIHMGQTRGGSESAFRILATASGATDYYDGLLNAAGTVLGTYLHGLFQNSDFRQVLLVNLRRRWGLPDKKISAFADKERQYDRLAEIVRSSVNIPTIYEIMGVKRKHKWQSKTKSLKNLT